MAQSQPKPWQHTLEKLYRRYDPAQVYGDAVRMLACALSLRTREAQYLGRASRSLVFPRARVELTLVMEREPYTDLLGKLFSSWRREASIRVG